MNRALFRSTLLSGMIAAALAPAAYAGDQPPPTDSAPASSSSTATPAAASPAVKTQAQREAEARTNAVNLTGVTVTPLRDSLQGAQAIKQNAKMVVDSIVAEDIGKLPDNSVADALQRVTGVQVAQGFQGETTSVVIRGLPNAVTTLNGRELFSSGGRQFSFQDLPATAVSGLDVYKSTDATMVTGGIPERVAVTPAHVPASQPDWRWRISARI